MKQKTKLFNFRFIFLISFSLICGLVLSYVSLRFNQFISVFIIIGLACITIIAATFYVRSLKKLILFLLALLVCLSFCLGGALLFKLNVNEFVSDTLGDDEAHNIDGRISKVIYYENDSYCYVLDEVFIDGTPLNAKIRAEHSTEYPFDLGTNISFVGYLQKYSLIYNGELNTYRILEKTKYLTSVLPENIINIGDIKRNVFERINYSIDSILQEGLSAKAYSVGLGLLLGNTDYMEEESLNQFRAGGIAHIFAVSGLHIGFLALAISFLLKKLPFPVPKIIQITLITVALFFYSGICGFSSSSLRAAIMFSSLLVFDFLGENSDGLSSIAFSSIIILLISPFELFGLGFQLSFTIILGIYILGDSIKRTLKFLPDSLASALGTVIGAQAFGMPVCLIYFDAFSSISVLTNLVFVPIVSIIFYVLFVAVILTMIIPVASIILFIPNYLLLGLNWCVNLFDFNIFLVGGFAIGGFIFVYYILLLISSELINLNKVIRAVTCVVLAGILAIGIPLYNYYLSFDVNITVFGSKSFCACLIDGKEENILIVSYASPGYSVSSLSKAVNGEVIDKLIILGYDPDVNSVLTNVLYVSEVKEVDCYGFAQPNIEKIFEGIKINYTFNESKKYENYTYSYIFEGKGVELEMKGCKLLVYDTLTLNDNYKDYDYSNVSFALAKRFPSDFPKPDNAIMLTYVKSDSFNYAEGKGIIRYKLRDGVIKPV